MLSFIVLGPIFLRDAFLGSFFLRENMNLMYFVRDVMIESLVVYVTETIFVREAVKLLFFRRVFLK